VPRTPRHRFRRRFLIAAAAAGSPLPAAALAPLRAVATSGGTAPPFCASAFQSLVGTVFEARCLSSDNRERVRLRSVDALPGEARSEQGFVLTFDARPGAAQDTYSLAHAALPPFAALMVPDAGGTALVAVFNRG